MTKTAFESNRALLAVLALAAAQATTACMSTEAPADPQPGGTEVLSLKATEHAGRDQIATEVFGLGDGPLQIEGTACTCTSQACVDDYIRAHIGCGVFVTFGCEDGRRVAGAVACDR